MTIRDLGYRAYEGAVLPASHNTWVLIRYGLWRIWGSWMNRFIVIFFWLPVAVFIGLALVRFFTIGREMPDLPPNVEADLTAAWFVSPHAADWLRTVTGVQFWFFVVPVTLRAGAGVIAEDFTHRAYQFYFSKPVAPAQYLLSRGAALAIFLFFLIFVPVMLMALVMAGVGPEEQRLERVGLILPALIDAILIASTMSVCAIGISALSRSRALTMSAWIALLVVPFVLAWLVQKMTETDWSFAGSIPSLLWVIGDALFKVERNWTNLEWFHAAPVVAALLAGGVAFAYRRIRTAEVIT